VAKIFAIRLCRLDVDRIKDKFFNLTNFEEIPETKRLTPDIDKIKYAVCKAYNIKEKRCM
jgi:hypothetical protein